VAPEAAISGCKAGLWACRRDTEKEWVVPRRRCIFLHGGRGAEVGCAKGRNRCWFQRAIGLLRRLVTEWESGDARGEVRDGTVSNARNFLHWWEVVYMSSRAGAVAEHKK